MDGGLFVVIASHCLWANEPSLRASAWERVWQRPKTPPLPLLGIQVHGKTLSKEVFLFFRGELRVSSARKSGERHLKLAPLSTGERKVTAPASLFRHVVFTVARLGEQHGHWPSPKFVGLLNKAELKYTSSFFFRWRELVRGDKRGAGRELAGEKERSYPGDRKLRGKAGKGWRRHSKFPY